MFLIYVFFLSRGLTSVRNRLKVISALTEQAFPELKVIGQINNLHPASSPDSLLLKNTSYTKLNMKNMKNEDDDTIADSVAEFVVDSLGFVTNNKHVKRGVKHALNYKERMEDAVGAVKEIVTDAMSDQSDTSKEA